MHNAITRLKEIFSENSLRNFADFRDLTPKQLNRLDASVYGWFSSFRTEAVQGLKEADGVNLCLGLKRGMEEFAIGAPMEMAIKKLSFFSRTGVILTPKFSSPGKTRRAIPESWYYLALNYFPLIETRSLTILPKAASYLVDEGGIIQGEGFIIKSRQPKVVQKDWFLLKEEIPSIRIVDLSEKSLRQQLIESHAHYGIPTGQQAYIYLPHLANISVELLSAVRKEHGDVFLRYNQIIQSFLAESSKASSEKRLLDAMRATDEGIRKIDAELTKISKSKVLQHVQVAVTTGVGVLCMFSDNPHTRELGKLLASGGLIPSGLRYLQLNLDKAAAISSTPFYFPWLIHTEANRLAPKA